MTSLMSLALKSSKVSMKYSAISKPSITENRGGGVYGTRIGFC